MIQSAKRLEKFFNHLLVFLLPTQLALHFWPPTAFVFGIRVDYLAPTLYLTDVLFLTLFMVWVRGNYKSLFSFIERNKVFLFLLVVLAVVNITFSTSVFPSVYKWVKIGELVIFYFYLKARKDIFNSKVMLSTLYYSLIFFSFIGISQFILGRTLGGPLYLLGERNFSASKPGIALVDLFDRIYMRAYSTFSHPNSFAGYIGLGLIPLLLTYSKKEIVKRSLGIGIICLAFLLTFSLSAFIGVTLCAVLIFFIRKNLFDRRFLVFVPSLFLLVSLTLPFISSIILNNKIDLPQNISQRVYLSSVAGSIISQKFLTGIGLNTFVIKEPQTKVLSAYKWILQPVHNIFLLIFSEVGIFGLILVYLLMVKQNREALLLNNKIFYLGLIFILVTGLTDHYWFTLQQNMLLLVIVLGNSFRVKR